MRILLVCEAVFPENKGGIERWFQNLAQGLLSHGNELTYFNSTNINDLHNGIQYVSSNGDVWSYKKGGVRSKTQAIRFGLNLFKWLRNQDFDLIYCSSVPIFSIFGVFFAKKRKAQVFIEWFEIWSLRYWVRYSGYVAGSLGWVIQFLALQLGTYRVVYTKRAAKTVSKLGFMNRHKAVLLPGLCPAVKPVLSTEHLVKKNDVYFLGRFVDEKQPFLAIDCVEAFARRGWIGTFWIIGTGPLAQELITEIETRELSSFVKVVKNPTDREVERITSNSFVLLHPSRREGYGLASVEAAYRGVPSLLIDYPDNATVELEIAPRLVARTDNLDEIVSLLSLAWENQEQFELETLAWAKQACESRSSSQTYRSILELALRTNSKQ